MTSHESGSSRHRIVVGLDGSDGADAALQWCVENASALNSEVVAVFALNPVVSVVPTPVLPPDMTQLETAATEMADELDGWCNRLREAGIPYRASVFQGRASEALQRVADEEDASMIVVGRRGRGGFTEMLLGSVPHDLTHRSTRPVLVVPVP